MLVTASPYELTPNQEKRGTLTLDPEFDLNLLLEQPITLINAFATSDEHCGVCKGRNGILRSHPTIIHCDEESPDVLDDAFQWSYIHPDEKGKAFWA